MLAAYNNYRFDAVKRGLWFMSFSEFKYMKSVKINKRVLH